MTLGLIWYPKIYESFNTQQNFSYFAIPDFWGLKSNHVFTDLKLNAPPFKPKSNNLIITQDIVNSLDKLVNNKIVFQDKQSSFFEFTDQTLFDSLE
jgi:hypothetical protein